MKMRRARDDESPLTTLRSAHGTSLHIRAAGDAKRFQRPQSTVSILLRACEELFVIIHEPLTHLLVCRNPFSNALRCPSIRLHFRNLNLPSATANHRAKQDSGFQ